MATELIKTRRSLKQSLTHINNYVNKKFNEDIDIEQLNVRYERLEEIWQKFDEVQNTLEALEPDVHDEVRATVEDMYLTIKATIKKLQRERAALAKTQDPGILNASGSEQSSSASGNVRLPKLSIPVFDGKYEHWKSFYDIFTTIIHENKTISDIEKLFYLRSSLKGDALQIIESISASNENYDVALQLLIDRYDNESYIINAHIKALFNLPQVSRDSVISLRSLLVEVKQHLRSLNTLKLPTEHWDDLIMYMITQKIDTSTRRAWELYKSENKSKTLKDLYNYLENRCISLESFSQDVNYDKSNFTNNNKIKQRAYIATNNDVDNIKNKTTNSSRYQCNFSCKLCNKNHYLFQCESFLKYNTKDKITAVKNHKVCYNCLKPSHTVIQCMARGCKICNKKHNTLIHIQDNQEQQSSVNSQNQEQAEDNTLKQTYFNTSATERQVLLGTVLLKVKDNSGNWHNARALLDSGSQSNFVTSELVTKLNLSTCSTKIQLSGINNMQRDVNLATNLTIGSRINTQQRNLNFLVMNNITCYLPHSFINYESWRIPNNVTLADPQFNTPGNIDLLLGAEIFYDILKPNQIKFGRHLPIMQETCFGWIISGNLTQRINNFKQEPRSPVTSMFVETFQDIKNDLEKFWKLEEVSTKTIRTKEERECEKHFETTTTRDDSGKYIVKLPIKGNVSELGDTYELALSRFNSLDRKLKNNEDLNIQYRQFMKEYLDLKHMEVVQEDKSNDTKYYIPHHAVVKESSSTTKLRVVFDASMKGTNQLSLNDLLKVGPVVQQDLISIVLRFRLYKYALTADIEKMYRQVLVDPEQTNLQRIIWYKENSNNPEDTEVYRLNTITYGTACAPYLATKCVQQVALDHGDNYSLAKSVVLEDFYVDDVMTGNNNLNSALKLQQELISLLQLGGFNLRKWCSNSQEILQAVEPNLRETQLPLVVGKTTVKTLGLFWLPAEDKLKFTINTNLNETVPLTKRIILSDIASIFDPLGLLGPLVIRAKQFLQRMWKEKVEWDLNLNPDITKEWFTFKTELKQLQEFEVNRRITNLNSENIKYEVHGFCDASQTAFGACVYLKCTDEHNNSTINLVCAKSRIAPLKPVTLPRLELCGAVILARLQHKMINSLQQNISATHLWTDSTIVLNWIAAEPTRWKQFIANRVIEIQELTNDCTWHHVPSSDNPADHLSRGLSATELQQNELWWKGPHWLLKGKPNWPQFINNTNFDTKDLEMKEEKSSLLCTLQLNIIDKFSNLTKLQRVFAYTLRFINNCKSGTEKLKENLSPSELKSALHVLIKLVQNETFKDEIKVLTNSNQVINGRLKNLLPFLDHNGILRVGGRLENLNINYDKKHPIILPKGHKLTHLILSQEHINLCHAGVQLVLANIRERYWPLQARSTIRKIIHQCTICFRLKATQATQLMGNIPSYRGDTTRAFTNTGVDYGGPFLIKQSTRRNSPLIKVYISLFICLSTRAIHLELVSSLSTEGFINAFKRFIARRGKCKTIYSDNATNFKGSKNELHELYKLFKEESFRNKLIDHAANQEIAWKFIPPNAPHFGGMWEAGIKAIKHHLRRVAGNTSFNFEQFYTLLTQIEACVNSRPLCPLSDDPSDYSILTPAHFLTGSSLMTIPEAQLTDITDNRLTQFQLIQKRVQSFWKQWSHDYLNTLQQRTKWNKILPNIPIGAIVLIKEDNVPPMNWLLGRIEETIAGRDGLVRVVLVRTATGIFKRPISKLCLLPNEK